MPSAKLSLSSPNKSERLVLSEHIHRCANTMEKFLEATQQFQDYKTEVFSDLDRKIEAKKQELVDVTQKITTEEEETRITTKQKIQEFKRDAAIQILAEFNEVPILSEELGKLRNDLDELRENRDETIAEEVDKVRKEEQKNTHTALNSMKLTHAAEIATLKASAEQKVREVEVLQETIQNLKHELAEQRELTKSVASSLKQGDRKSVV